MAEDEEELADDAELTELDADDDDFADDDFGDDEFDDDDDSFDEDDDDDDDDEASSPAAGRPADDEEDEEPDPDDVEEDLDTILRDKIASGDDLEDEDEDEDEQVVAPVIEATEGDKVAPKRENEWTCTGCFLIVSSRQFGRKGAAVCPSGEADCPSLDML